MTQTVRDAIFVTHQLIDDGMGNVTTVGSQLISDRAGIVWTMPHVSSNITAMDVTQKLTLKQILGNSNVVEASALLTNLGAGVYTSNSAPPQDGMFLRAISKDEAKWSFIEDIPFFSADIIEGNIVCVNQVIQTNLIEEKTPGSGVTFANALTFTQDVTSLGTIFGDLQGDTFGTHYGRVEGNLVGNVVCAEELSTSRLTEKNTSQGILIEGDVSPSQDDAYELGNLAAKWTHIFTNDLTVCRDATIEGNLTINGQLLANLDVMLTDPFIINTLCAQTVQTTVLEEKNAGEGISTTGNITPSTNNADSLGSLSAKWAHIYTTDLTVCGNATFEQDISLAGELSGNTVGTHIGPTIGDLTGNVTASTVCATEIQASLLKEKVVGQGLSIEGDVTPNQDDVFELGNLAAKWAHIFVNDLTVCRDATFEGDVTVNGRLFANVEAAIGDPLTIDTLCAQTVQTTVLEEKNDGEGILTSGNIAPSITGVDSLGALDAKWSHIYTNKLTVCQEATFESDVSIGGTLEADLVGNVTGDTTGTHFGPVIGDVEGDVTGNVTGSLTGPSFGKHTGPVCGDVEGDLVGNVVGDTTGTHFGPVIGDIEGDVTGNVTGSLTGPSFGKHTGPVCGDVTGNVVGDLVGDTTGTHFGPVIGDLTGNTTGVHCGPVKGDVTGNVVGDLVGDVTGNVVGDLVGDVIGNTTGTHCGPVKGDVVGNLTGDVLGNTTGTHFGPVVGDVVGDVIGDLTGNTTGTHFGPVVGDLTGNVDASTICTPELLVENIIEKTSGITITGDVIPSANDAYELGNLAAKWAHIFTNDLTACENLSVEGTTTLMETTLTGDLTVNGNATISDTLTVQDACITGYAELDDLRAKTGAAIAVTGDIIPSADDTYEIGNLTAKWAHIFTNDLTACQTLTVEGATSLQDTTVTGDLTVNGNATISDTLTTLDACVTGVLELDEMLAKNDGNIIFTGDLLPGNTLVYDIGSDDRKINTVWTDDIVICGQIIGNVAVDGELSANTLVSFGDVCLNGNLQANLIKPKTGGSIRVIGNLFADNIEGPEGTVQIACVQYTQGEVQTTDGTQTIVVSIDMVDDNVCFVQTQTVGEGSTGDVIALRTLYAFKYDASGNSIVRVGTPSQVKFGDSGTNNWKEIATALNGTELKSSAQPGSIVQIRVQGAAGTTINWRSCTERICI